MKPPYETPNYEMPKEYEDISIQERLKQLGIEPTPIEGTPGDLAENFRNRFGKVGASPLMRDSDGLYSSDQTNTDVPLDLDGTLAK